MDTPYICIRTYTRTINNLKVLFFYICIHPCLPSKKTQTGSIASHYNTQTPVNLSCLRRDTLQRDTLSTLGDTYRVLFIFLIIHRPRVTTGSTLCPSKLHKQSEREREGERHTHTTTTLCGLFLWAQLKICEWNSRILGIRDIDAH